MQVKLGGKYKLWNGETVHIVGETDDPTFPFRGVSLTTGRVHKYMADGQSVDKGWTGFDIDTKITDSKSLDFTAQNEPAIEMIEVMDTASIATPEVQAHPLFPIFCAAIEQAMYGKGQRHGGNTTAFFDQPWTHYQKMHGRGFLTGQSAKKLEEAASQRTGSAFETEVLGAIVYAGMAILADSGSIK